MKKPLTVILAALLALTLAFPLAGCTSKLEQNINLGMTCLSEENYEAAILAFDNAIEIDPNSVPAYEGRGDAYAALDDYEAAATDYLAAIELADEDQLAALHKKLEDVYFAQAAELLRWGRLDGALALIDRVDANELLPLLCAEVRHTPTPANFQQPEICMVCGEQVGEPLPADFETYGLTAHLVQPEQEYDYHTMDYTETSPIVGKARFSHCRVFTSDETHEAREGYEWRIAEITVVYGDGWNATYDFNDYYNIAALNYSFVPDDSMEGAVYAGSFTVNWNGADYTECHFALFEEMSDWIPNADPAHPDWDTVCTDTIRYEVLVPIGYDGIVCALINCGVETENKHLFEWDNSDSLFFRMA